MENKERKIIEDAVINRVLELISDAGKTMPEFQKMMNIQSQHWTNWKKRGIPAQRKEEIADLFDAKLDWLKTGREDKYWKKQVGYLDVEYSLDVNPVTTKTDASEKLIEIINEADKAMNDSKCEFTVDERIDYYLEALTFAGRKDFSPDFIRQYVKELLKQK